MEVPMKQSADIGSTRKKPYQPSRFHRILPGILFLVVWELFAQINSEMKFTNPAYLPGPITIVTTPWELAKTGLNWERI
jgi:ABC-type nitrate/sulfonate/bicarbonate transport system permease component